jgi:hypothetical protein
VLATDLPSPGQLDLLRRNFARNAGMIGDRVAVAGLDFRDDLAGVPGLQGVDTVLAGDVIYDDSITDSFVEFLLRLRGQVAGPLRAVLAMERRIVFTLEELEPRAPAYEHLMARLAVLEGQLEVKRLPIDWDQHFCYERSEELVLLELRLTEEVMLDSKPLSTVQPAIDPKSCLK